MNLTNISFEGKKGIITGGAMGIGKAIAEQFVALGGKAIIADINEEAAKAACEELGNASYYIVNLGDMEDTTRVFKEIVEKEEKVEVLINNAGIVNTDDFDKLTLENWNRVINIDLTSVFVTCQILFNHMAEIGGGRIVNVASIAAKVGGGYLGTAAYASAKNGVLALTKAIAKAGSTKNIYCNSLCPGFNKTPLTSKNLAGEKEEIVRQATALHRAADPEETANAILFLASDAASFIQGENIICDGGMLMQG